MRKSFISSGSSSDFSPLAAWRVIAVLMVGGEIRNRKTKLVFCFRAPKKEKYLFLPPSPLSKTAREKKIMFSAFPHNPSSPPKTVHACRDIIPPAWKKSFIFISFLFGGRTEARVWKMYDPPPLWHRVFLLFPLACGCSSPSFYILCLTLPIVRWLNKRHTNKRRGIPKQNHEFAASMGGGGGNCYGETANIWRWKGEKKEWSECDLQDFFSFGCETINFPFPDLGENRFRNSCTFLSWNLVSFHFFFHAAWSLQGCSDWDPPSPVSSFLPKLGQILGFFTLLNHSVNIFSSQTLYFFVGKRKKWTQLQTRCIRSSLLLLCLLSPSPFYSLEGREGLLAKGDVTRTGSHKNKKT